MPPVGKGPGPSLRTSLAVIAVGALVAVPCFVLVALRASGGLTAPTISTPGTKVKHLGSGRWFVYERTGTSRGGGGITVTNNDAPDLRPSDLSATGPDGQALAVGFVTVSETITRGSRIFTAVLEFDVPTAEDVTLRFSGPSSDVIVSRSLGDSFSRVAGFAVAGAGGAVTGGVGVVLLIVGSVRRGRAGRHQGFVPAGAWGTPPGWYPDPTQGGQPRWWDGSAWRDGPA